EGGEHGARSGIGTAAEEPLDVRQAACEARRGGVGEERRMPVSAAPVQEVQRQITFDGGEQRKPGLDGRVESTGALAGEIEGAGEPAGIGERLREGPA